MNRRLVIGLTALGASLAAASPSTASEKSSGTSAPPAPFLQFPTATASCMRPDGRRSVLSVEIGIDVADIALRARADLSRPRLNAAYVEVIRIAANRLLPGYPPDVEWLSRALQSATDRILGATGAKLLLGTVVIT